MMVTSRVRITQDTNTAAASAGAGISTMKLLLITALLLFISLPPTNSQSHVIRKRFLWKTLAQLANPFLQKPRPPQAYPQQPPYRNPYPAPPVFQVSATAPHPIHVPPSSGQLYLPLPGQNNYQQNAPRPVYVPPASYGVAQPPQLPQLPQLPQPPQPYPQQSPLGEPQWKPMATQAEGGPLYYGGVGAPVGPPSFQFQQGGVSDVSLTNGFPLSGVDVASLVSEPFRGSSVFLASSDRVAPTGFIKVSLPATILRSVLGLGLDEPTVYLASTSIAPSQDFALLEVNNETVESLRAIAQQPNSSRAAEMPPTAAEDLVTAIKTAAPKLAGNTTSIDLDDMFAAGELSFADMTDTSETPSESTKSSETDPTTVESLPNDFTEADSPAELASVFLARRDADVPGDYIRVLLPDDILKELRRRVTLKTLNAQGVMRHDLTEAYLAPSTSIAVRPPLGLVSVPLSREALQVLNDYANTAEKSQISNDNGPQLELPRSVLEQLSKDSSQRVRLIAGGRDTVVKTGSTDVFIAPSDQKPPDGYVSIPLSEDAMSELRKNFLGTSIRTQDVQKGIPVRAYIAPADKKLPAGHVAVPLPDSILDSVKSTSTDGRRISRPSPKATETETVDSSFLQDSTTAVYLAPSYKQAPSSFRKLKLPETIMEDLRQAIPAAKLLESGMPAKDLTAAYLASAKEFVPPGFLSITVPDTLVKMLDAFADTKESNEVNEVLQEAGKSSSKNKGRGSSGSRDLGGEEGSNISRKIIDALLEATGRTVSQVFKNSRGESRNRGRGSRGRGNGRDRDRDRKPSSSRDNARITSADAEENDFDGDDGEETIDMYQPQYQSSPFFPASISSYPYVNPYQYNGLWTYGDPSQWMAEGGNPMAYSEYLPEGTAENQEAYYYDDGREAGAVQYDIGQHEYDGSNFKKRHGEVQKESN